MASLLLDALRPPEVLSHMVSEQSSKRSSASRILQAANNDDSIQSTDLDEDHIIADFLASLEGQDDNKDDGDIAPFLRSVEGISLAPATLPATQAYKMALAPATLLATQAYKMALAKLPAPATLVATKAYTKICEMATLKAVQAFEITKMMESLESAQMVIQMLLQTLATNSHAMHASSMFFGNQLHRYMYSNLTLIRYHQPFNEKYHFSKFQIFSLHKTSLWISQSAYTLHAIQTSNLSLESRQMSLLFHVSIISLSYCMHTKFKFFKMSYFTSNLKAAYLNIIACILANPFPKSTPKASHGDSLHVIETSTTHMNNLASCLYLLCNIIYVHSYMHTQTIFNRQQLIFHALHNAPLSSHAHELTQPHHMPKAHSLDKSKVDDVMIVIIAHCAKVLLEAVMLRFESMFIALTKAGASSKPFKEWGEYDAGLNVKEVHNQSGAAQAQATRGDAYYNLNTRIKDGDTPDQPRVKMKTLFFLYTIHVLFDPG